jgi:hypothetical protein
MKQIDYKLKGTTDCTTEAQPVTGVLQKSGFSAKLNICSSNSTSSQSPKTSWAMLSDTPKIDKSL